MDPFTLGVVVLLLLGATRKSSQGTAPAAPSSPSTLPTSPTGNRSITAMTHPVSSGYLNLTPAQLAAVAKASAQHYQTVLTPGDHHNDAVAAVAGIPPAALGLALATPGTPDPTVPTPTPPTDFDVAMYLGKELGKIAYSIFGQDLLGTFTSSMPSLTSWIGGTASSAADLAGVVGAEAAANVPEIAGAAATLASTAATEAAAMAYGGALVAIPSIIGHTIEMLNAPSADWLKFPAEVHKTLFMEQNDYYTLAQKILFSKSDAEIQQAIAVFRQIASARIGPTSPVWINMSDPFYVQTLPGSYGTEHGFGGYNPWHPGWTADAIAAGLNAMVASARRGETIAKRWASFLIAFKHQDDVFYSSAFGRVGISPQQIADMLAQNPGKSVKFLYQAYLNSEGAPATGPAGAETYQPTPETIRWAISMTGKAFENPINNQYWNGSTWVPAGSTNYWTLIDRSYVDGLIALWNTAHGGTGVDACGNTVYAFGAPVDASGNPLVTPACDPGAGIPVPGLPGWIYYQATQTVSINGVYQGLTVALQNPTFAAFYSSPRIAATTQAAADAPLPSYVPPPPPPPPPPPAPGGPPAGFYPVPGLPGWGYDPISQTVWINGTFQAAASYLGNATFAAFYYSPDMQAVLTSAAPSSGGGG
jgi:hypothetical protein